MRTQYIPSIGLFYKKVGRLWKVSDCEELVGVITGDDGGGRLLREGDSNETI